MKAIILLVRKWHHSSYTPWAQQKRFLWTNQPAFVFQAVVVLLGVPKTNRASLIVATTLCPNRVRLPMMMHVLSNIYSPCCPFLLAAARTHHTPTHACGACHMPPQSSMIECARVSRRTRMLCGEKGGWVASVAASEVERERESTSIKCCVEVPSLSPFDVRRRRRLSHKGRRGKMLPREVEGAWWWW